jgi:hypothetical protein
MVKFIGVSGIEHEIYRIDEENGKIELYEVISSKDLVNKILQAIVKALDYPKGKYTCELFILDLNDNKQEEIYNKRGEGYKLLNSPIHIYLINKNENEYVNEKISSIFKEFENK